LSKLHVKQIEGYLTSKLKSVIDMDDYAGHSDKGQLQKAFLTRGLAALAVSQLAEVALEELGPNITDGSKDGGIDLIYFEPKERTLYLVQSKWHDDGHGHRGRGGQRGVTRSLPGRDMKFAPAEAVSKLRRNAEARNVDAAATSIDELTITHL